MAKVCSLWLGKVKLGLDRLCSGFLGCDQARIGLVQSYRPKPSCVLRAGCLDALDLPGCHLQLGSLPFHFGAQSTMAKKWGSTPWCWVPILVCQCIIAQGGPWMCRSWDFSSGDFLSFLFVPCLLALLIPLVPPCWKSWKPQ